MLAQVLWPVRHTGARQVGGRGHHDARVLGQRATMTGIVVADYYPRAGQAMMEMGGWIGTGKLKSREHIVQGPDKFPEAFDMLFSGANEGKLVLQVAAD